MKRLIFLTLLLSIPSILTFGQRNVTGRLLDSETHLPIKGAKVIISGTDIETVTDSLGDFQLVVVDNAAIIDVFADGFPDGIFGIPKSKDIFEIQLTKGVYTIVDEQPVPEGGMADFYGFVGKNLRYPQEARKKGIEGRVFVQFVVDNDGSLTEVQVVRGIGGGCDEEAVRVISIAPKWKPGKEKGQVVKVRLILPVTFKLG